MNHVAPNGYQSSNQVPFWAVVLSACAVVLTGYMLGATWLDERVLGLPAGLWMVGFVAAATSSAVRSRIAGFLESLWLFIEPGTGARAYALQSDSHLAVELPASESEESGLGGWWPSGSVASVVVDGLTRLAGMILTLAWLPIARSEVMFFADKREQVEAWLSRCAWPTRPLRVGLCIPDDEARALIAASGSCRVEWYRLNSWDDPQAACRHHLFDAVVHHDGEGPLRIVTLERPDSLASVVEWAGLPDELCYGALFPGLIDPAAVVLEGSSQKRVREGAGLLRAIIEAAATLARSGHRLSLADRMLGRHATDRIERAAGNLSLWRSSRAPACTVMAALAKAAAAHREAWPEAATLAAEAGSAYFVAGLDIEPIDRRKSLLESAQGVGTTAATALRLGAACIGALEDDEGIAWLVKADTLLRTGATKLAKLDHAAFLESELVHGSDDPMSVGRAAAGICMVCASTEPQTLRFLRDDMLEEMAYAGWLVGRDQDRSLLIRVFHEIQAAHTTTEKGRGQQAVRSRKKKHGKRSAA